MTEVSDVEEVDPIEEVTLRGDVYVFGRNAEADDLVHSLELPGEEVGVTWRGNARGGHMGKATVTRDGDRALAARVRVVPSEVWRLTRTPYLSLTLRVTREGGKEVAHLVQVNVSGSVTDPRQRPYRVVGCPVETELLRFTGDYLPVIVVDEAGDFMVTEKGIDPADPRVHVEWRHRSERWKTEVPRAVRRGMGYDDAGEPWTEDELERFDAVVDEVLRSLG